MIPRKYDKSIYNRYLEENKHAINSYVDSVIAVSERVKDVFIKEGYNPEIIRTMYIGTKAALRQTNSSCFRYSLGSDFHIAYFGYMTESKGFYFLLDALEELEDEIASHICVKICAKYDKRNVHELKRIEALRKRFKQIELHNGFTHDNEKELLSDVHLGIVPVLWEDNLPQVLIEQISYGVPILVSNLGGGREIVNNSAFVFKAGDTSDFLGKLISIYTDPELLNDFWDHSMRLVTCESHINELLSLYKSIACCAHNQG
jgi:glycosyltransferase involved in cell wall biosynthesis